MSIFDFLSSYDTESIYAFGFFFGFIFCCLLFALIRSVSSFFTKHFVIGKIFKLLKIHQSNVVLDLNDLEGYFKFNPDGSICRVSDLDINVSDVDINKPTSNKERK